MNSLVEKAMPPEGFKPYERKGEKIGGGFFVIRRGRIAGRIKPSERPFEHPNLSSAIDERNRLRKLYPDCKYSILMDVEF